MGNPKADRMVAALPLWVSAAPFPPLVTQFGGLARILGKHEPLVQVEPVRGHTRKILWRVGGDLVRTGGCHRPDVEGHYGKPASVLRLEAELVQSCHEPRETAHLRRPGSVR